MSKQAETEKLLTIHADFGGVDERRAASATDIEMFQRIDSVFPWQGEHRRVFGKKIRGRMVDLLGGALSVITIHSLPGNRILIQTRGGLTTENL